MKDTGQHDTREKDDSLWWLAAAPLVWVGHLLASYITAAIFCAKAETLGTSLDSVRLAIVGYTAVALAAVVAIGFRGLRRHRFQAKSSAHDFDTPDARYRFLGFATVLLSGVSALAIVYVALPILFMETCR